MKLEYILIVVLAVGALAFLGNTFGGFGSTAKSTGEGAVNIVNEISQSSASGN